MSQSQGCIYTARCRLNSGERVSAVYERVEGKSYERRTTGPNPKWSRCSLTMFIVHCCESFLHFSLSGVSCLNLFSVESVRHRLTGAMEVLILKCADIPPGFSADSSHTVFRVSAIKKHERKQAWPKTAEIFHSVGRVRRPALVS